MFGSGNMTKYQREDEVKIKRRRLNEDIVTMEKSADDLAQKAEDKGKLTLISQSNSLRGVRLLTRKCN